MKMGKGEDPAVKAAGFLGDIKAELINLIRDLPAKIKEGVNELPAAIGDAIVDHLPGGKEARVDVRNFIDRNRHLIPPFIG